MTKPLNLKGRAFGKLTALSQIKIGPPKYQTKWVCLCRCGKKIKAYTYHLISGNTTSCGCRRVDAMKGNNFSTRHGAARKGKMTKLYRVWCGMKQRCYDSNHISWKQYGGRGITVCKEWKHSFESFMRWALINGFGSSLQIERIKNSAGYSPSNCKWATRAEQCNNKRCNIIIKVFGVRSTISEAASVHRVSRDALYQRINRGQNPEESILKLKSKDENRIRGVNLGNAKSP